MASSSSSLSPRSSTVNERHEERAARVDVASPTNLMGNGVQGKQGSKRSITCLDTRVAAPSRRDERLEKQITSDAVGQDKSEQSTRDRILTEVGHIEEYEEDQLLTTAMSHEREPDAGVRPSPFDNTAVGAAAGVHGSVDVERSVEGENNTSKQREKDMSRGESELSDASRSTYSKSSTFPRSKTELVARDQPDATVGVAIGVAAASLPCPPHGAKSVMGRRAKMEDTFVAIPDLIGVAFADSLNQIIPPRIADQMQQINENDSSAKESARSGSGSWSGNLGTDARADKLKSDSDTIVHATSSKVAEMKRRDEIDILAASAVAGAGVPGGKDTRGTAPRSGRPKMLFEQIHFFGVFDGHGGADAAHHCQETMHERLKEAIIASCPRSAMEQVVAASGKDKKDTNFDALDDTTFSELEASLCSSEAFSNALARAFKVTDEEFAKLNGAEEELSLVGTTAVVTLLSSQSIYVANAGDSRAVLLRNGKAVALTDDHKAAREDETARVEAAGGQILFWNGVRVMGLLAVSRAIGDHSLRPYVIADPEVTVMNRHPGDELMVMASDGLWDVITNQEACSLAKKCLMRARQKGSTRENAARVAATVLTRAAVDRGSRDNVTVLVIDLMQDPDELIDQDALKMYMSEDLGAVRRFNQNAEVSDGRPSSVGKGQLDRSDRSNEPGNPDDPDDVDLDAGINPPIPDENVSAGREGHPMSLCGHGTPLTRPPPAPFMPTPFDDAESTEDIGDGLEAIQNQEVTEHLNLATSASYRSPFETLDLGLSRGFSSQEYGCGGSPTPGGNDRE